MVKNRLFYFHQQIELQRNCRINQKDFGQIIGGFSQYKVSKWESQTEQPNVHSAFIIFCSLKKIFPDLHMEDLFSPE